jgi:hypothetical protein
MKYQTENVLGYVPKVGMLLLLLFKDEYAVLDWVFFLEFKKGKIVLFRVEIIRGACAKL